MQGSGKADRTPTVESEAVVLDCMPAGQGRTLGYTNWAKLKIKGLVAGETPEVVMVSAAFRKTQPGEELLRVEIVADDAVVAAGETFEELGTVDLNWPRKRGG